MQLTSTNRIPTGMAEALAELGVSYQEVLRRAGLPDRHLDAPGERVTVLEYFALWDAILAAGGDPGIGIRLATVVKPDLTEPFFLAMLSCRCVADALHVLSAYKRMLSAERIEVHTDPGDGASVVTYCWPPVGREPPQILVDAELAFLVEACRRSTRTPSFSPREIHLRTRALAAGAGHEGYFRCPLRLSAARNTATFAAEDVARPFVTHNPRMLAALIPYLQDNLPDAHDTVVSRVRTVIAARIRGQRATVRSVARELGMSERALQRALQESGTSFRDLVDEVRNEHAQRYLARAKFSDSEVAFLLGFEDPNSFSRAFRAWNGMSPSEFRKRPNV